MNGYYCMRRTCRGEKNSRESGSLSELALRNVTLQFSQNILDGANDNNSLTADQKPTFVRAPFTSCRPEHLSVRGRATRTKTYMDRALLVLLLPQCVGFGSRLWKRSHGTENL